MPETRVGPTPGPWEVVEKPLEYRIDGPDDAWDVAEVAKDERPNARANARLIAAAPDLLIASRRGIAAIHDAIGRPEGERSEAITMALDSLHAAVAKAEGREGADAR